jgi:N-methylhydantoinase B
MTIRSEAQRLEPSTPRTLGDGALLEILKNRFQAIVNEMGATVQRTGHTIFIKETADFGSVLVSPKGEIFSAPLNIGVTVLIGTPMDDAIRAIDTYEEGDVVISNDPTSTGAMATHLPDLYLWRPIFHGGELVCFAWTFIHCSDIGGKVPGSISPTSFDVFQEGLVIPPTKLFKKGELNREFFRLFGANSRIPEQNWGDVKALVAALTVAERRVSELIERYDVDTVRRGMDAVLEYAEMQAREVIERIPDGTYRFSDYMEGHVANLGAIRIKADLHVRGGDLYLDFAETDPQVPAAINMPTHSKTGHWMIVPALVKYLKTENPHIAYNSGMVRPIRLGIPRGSLLNPEPRAAVGVRAATMFRFFDVVCGALAQARPDRIPAAGSGQGSIVVVSTLDVESGKNKISVVQPLCGGCGGRPHKDGIDGVDFSLGSLRNVPTESLESEMPVLILKYGLREDSSGHGRYRGGTGVVLRVRILTPDTFMTARGMERYLFRPWGLYGGQPGTTGYTRLMPRGGVERDIGQIDLIRLEPGDEIQFGTQGAGGFGDPLDRDPERVVWDVRQGLVAERTARDVYGVALDAGVVDPVETARLRSVMRASPDVARVFTFGSEREAYESTWTEDLQDAVVAAIRSLPGSIRFFIRGKLRQRVEEALAAGHVVLPDDVPTMLRHLTSEYGWSPAA